MSHRKLIPIAFLMCLAGLLTAGYAFEKNGQAKPENAGEGFTDTPFLPGGKWRVHGLHRPHPPFVTPGAKPGDPPSDAIVLFDGTDLSKWVGRDHGKLVPPRWKLGNGYMEVVPGTGDLLTKQKFGDCQLHIEWAAPAEIVSHGQLRGNSGVMMMGLYEIQVLDSYNNVTYADGQAAAMYGQYPPRVNVCRPPGEWQTYDIVFEAPVFDGDKLVKPAYLTLFHNGVLIHNRQAFMGPVIYKALTKYRPHPPTGPILLQNHGCKVRFRNIWVRNVKGYDER